MWTISKRMIAALAIGAAFVTLASVAAQDARTLVVGTPVTGVLNTQNISEVYTFEAEAGQTVSVAATNDLGVPLAISVTDVAGNPVAQAVDEDVDGSLLLPEVVFADAGTYYLTVFKAGGIASIAEVTFELVLEDATAAQVQPTAAPEVTAEAGAEVTPVVTPAPSLVVTTSGLQVELAWDSTDDLDLEVRDPVGGSLYWRTPTTSSGGSLSPNANQGCVTPVAPARETASWTPGGIPTGSYEVLVYFQQSCNNDAPATFTVTPTVDGVPLGPVEGSLNPGQVYVLGFTVNADGTATLNNDGGVFIPGTLPASPTEIAANAQPIAPGESATGAITNAQPYQSYVFEAQADLLYTIAVSATSGSLDTYVAVLDGAGNIVRENDDLAAGNTNSLITNLLVPASGQYYILVSRYAKALGATEGTFELTLTSSDIDLPADFAANITPGSLGILLVWNTNADLQLLVRDPAGDAVFDDVPQIRSGGQLLASGNVNCQQSDGAPYSYIYWPTDIPPRPGSYEVEVWYQNDCDDTSPVTANLYIQSEGQTVYSSTFSPVENERFLTSFEIAADGTVTPGPGGIVRGAEDLNYASEIETATPIQSGVPVTGSITPDNKYDLYTFDGAAGDVVNIAMNNTSGTLDPQLYLIGPTGVVLASNDDAVAGENTNSLIANFTLPADGPYIIIATHFGGLYGGTTGTYQLTFTLLN